MGLSRAEASDGGLGIPARPNTSTTSRASSTSGAWAWRSSRRRCIRGGFAIGLALELFHVHVERDPAQRSCCEGRDQRLLVDDFARRDVHQKGAGLHGGEGLAADQPGRLRRPLAADRHGVAVREQSVETLLAFQAVNPREVRYRLRVEAPRRVPVNPMPAPTHSRPTSRLSLGRGRETKGAKGRGSNSACSGASRAHRTGPVRGGGHARRRRVRIGQRWASSWTATPRFPRARPIAIRPWPWPLQRLRDQRRARRSLGLTGDELKARRAGGVTAPAPDPLRHGRHQPAPAPPGYGGGQAAMFDQLCRGRFIMASARAAPADRAGIHRHDPEGLGQDPPYRIDGKLWKIALERNIYPEYRVGWIPRQFQQPHPPIAISLLTRHSNTARTAGSVVGSRCRKISSTGGGPRGACSISSQPSGTRW